MTALRTGTALLVTTAALCAAAPAGAATTAPAPARDSDPVVVTGAQTPSLLGARPKRIVAFRWTGGRWRQIPVQVDERARVDLGTVYDGKSVGRVTGFAPLVYTDPGTFTGADPDPAVDADDEIALMYRDAGAKAPRTKRPKGVGSAPAAMLRLADPLGGASRYVYLFANRTNRLDPSAGRRYVDYAFRLDSGGYRSTYRLQNGPNPEHSTVVTPAYHAAFTDRFWTPDLSLTSGGADGRDILDRLTAQFAPGTCGRSEQTFRSAEGAFIANRSGPVRAIRSYIGANSGPLTQRDQIMYDRRMDIRTYLRVHPIPGVMDLVDYSRAAVGMTYRDERNPAGVPVDGTPDALAPGLSGWDQVSGAQGTLTNVVRFTKLPAGVSATTYRVDRFAPPASVVRLCTGDRDAVSLSGPWVDTPIPNTDPRKPAAAFEAVRTLYMDGPAAGTAARARAYARAAAAPITARLGRMHTAR